MTAPIPVPTNLREWSTPRLQVLVKEYKESLPSIRALYGKNHVEMQTYQNWISAMEEELVRRYDQRQ